MTTLPELRLDRADISQALGLPPEILARIEEAESLSADAEGRFDLMAVATAAARFGLRKTDASDQKIAAVASALSAVRPALERLADLPGRAELTGESHDKAMAEVAAFFSAFAEAMNKATAVLTAPD
jgi:hypothetical protein